MLISNTSTPLRLLPIPLLLIFYCIYLQLPGHSNVPLPPLFNTKNPPTSIAGSTNLTELKSTFDTTVKEFWNDLATVLENVRPSIPPIRVEDGHPTSSETTFEPLNITKTPPKRLVDFTEEHETALLRSHYLMRVSAQQLAPRLVFSEGEKGIVTTANAKYMPIFLVSLRMLRRTGCQLPVEVFIDDWTKYDSDICETVLPSLNAACVVLSEIYDTVLDVQKPTSYQFKLFAVLFSSFQHVLFLDSDAFPAHDPTGLFTTTPYTNHGLVVWPDLFGLTISQHYYHIAAIPYEPPSSRASTESGIVLLDKAQHRESFLMMMYYNYHGPDYYYPLLCQGSHGAGDKETFVQAAKAVGLPWYQVKAGVAGVGFFEDGGYRLSGMAQMDPRTDYAYIAPSKSHIHPEDRWQAKDFPVGKAQVPPRPLFVHQNMHKLDPARILDLEGTTARTREGNYTRMWGGVKGNIEVFGYDIERRVWEVVIEEGCRVDAHSEVCMKVRGYFDEVFRLVDSIDG